MFLLRALPPFIQFVLLFLSLFGLFGRTFFYAELVGHFNLQYAAGSVLMASFFIWRRVWLKWLALSAIVIFINLLPFSDLYYGSQPAAAIDDSFKLVSFNLLDTNSNKEGVKNYLLQTEADLLVLMEYTPEWRSSLDTLRKKYPHFHEVPLRGHFGMAVFSNLEAQFEERYYAMDEVPSIMCNFKWRDENVKMIATHPTPPVSPFDWEARNYQFNEIIKERIENTGESYMIVGDLNATSHTSIFSELMETTFTRDSRIGFGLQPTWPTWNKLFFLALDHCLVSDYLIIKNRQTGPYLQSDHLPIEVEISYRKKF